MVTKMYSVADLARVSLTSSANINQWRNKWYGFPQPLYCNQQGLGELWSEEAKDVVLGLITRHREAKRR